MKAKPLGKRKIDRIISGVGDELHYLYARARSHVPRPDAITEAALCEAMVKGDDLPFVRRSVELFGYTRSSYYGSAITTVTNFPGTEFKLRVELGKRASWILPGYMANKERACSELPEAFVPLLQPLVSTLDPLLKSYLKTCSGWTSLRDLCANDLSRMYFLWPTIGTLAKRMEVDLSALPKPRGVPGVSPELRDQLNEGTSFVNMIMMMPEHRSTPDEEVSISLHA